MNVLVDKYDLCGVRMAINTNARISAMKSEIEFLKRQNEQLNKRSHLEVEYAFQREYHKSAPFSKGLLVGSRPPLGSRVTRTLLPAVGYEQKKGTIIANDEDNGTEVGVRWDDGSESHFLQCAKKGRYELRYL